MKSYLKFLSRNKLYTLIEAVGLVVSLAFVILIGTYVWQQYSAAYAHPDHNRIYVLTEQRTFGSGYYDKEDIDSNIPEMEISTRYSFATVPLEINDRTLNEVPVMEVDKEFFELFPCTFIEGSADIFDDAFNVVVTRSFANTLTSGGGGVIGMTFVKSREEGKVFRIAAVIENLDNPIFPSTDIIFNQKNSMDIFSEIPRYMASGFCVTLFRVAENTDRELLQEKLFAQFEENYSDFNVPVLHDLDELYFYEHPHHQLIYTNPATLQMLVVVVLALLASAVMNYINLTFALSGKRANEIATRRLMGAARKDIFMKNIMESVTFTMVCFILALLLALVLEPMMNTLLGLNTKHSLPIAIRLTPAYIAVWIFSVTALGLLAGLVPSVHASHFKPIDVIKGGFRLQSKMLFSKCFIVVQNVISVVLISLAILMEVQLSHMIDRPMNTRTDNLFFMNITCGSRVSDIQPLIDRIEDIPEVQQVGIGSAVPGNITMGVGFKDTEGKQILTKVIICDTTCFRLLSPEIITDLGHSPVGSAWISESLAGAMTLTDSTELRILNSLRNINYSRVENIGGVYKDIPTESVIDGSNPYSAIIVLRRDRILWSLGLLIQTSTESKAIKAKIMKEYNDFISRRNLDDNIRYADYIDDINREKLVPAIRTIRLVELFMFLAILLSMLGLVAMSTYFSDQKSKDIAIRKVFGGTIFTETYRNVRGYMLLALTACMIGVPVAVYAADRYLERFAYRIDGCWWIFAIGIILTLALSLLSVLWQTLRVARTNPATELKKE